MEKNFNVTKGKESVVVLGVLQAMTHTKVPILRQTIYIKLAGIKLRPGFCPDQTYVEQPSTKPVLFNLLFLTYQNHEQHLHVPQGTENFNNT
jgi:hypothetical protein